MNTIILVFCVLAQTYSMDAVCAKWIICFVGEAKASNEKRKLVKMLDQYFKTQVVKKYSRSMLNSSS